jgi:hypothetical protein
MASKASAMDTSGSLGSFRGESDCTRVDLRGEFISDDDADVSFLINSTFSSRCDCSLVKKGFLEFACAVDGVILVWFAFGGGHIKSGVNFLKESAVGESLGGSGGGGLWQTTLIAFGWNANGLTFLCPANGFELNGALYCG